MEAFLGFLMVLVWYLVPTIVAAARRHQVGMVAVLNVFLGWTIIGWFIALAIACGDNRDQRVIVYAPPPRSAPPSS
jgi:hypothetical protein